MKRHVFIKDSKGKIKLTAPYEDLYVPDEIYTVSAITSIEAMSALGHNVLEMVYLSVGLTEEDYLADLKAKVDIVTFSGGSKGSLRVPASQVQSLPDQTTVPYHEAIISVSLGPMPDSYDYTNFRSELAQYASDISGKVVALEQVRLSVLRAKGSVDLDQHKEMETIRKNNVKNRNTSRGRELALAKENDELKVKLAAMSQILLDNGWVPEE